MANLAPRNLSQIRATNSALGECLTDIVHAHNNTAQQVNASPVGTTPAPVPHSSLQVVGGGGFFRVQIVDHAPGFRGKENFVEVSETADFTAPHVIHLGASQSWYGNLGSKMLHFRSYAQLPTSPPSIPIYALNINGSNSTIPSVQGNGTASGWGKHPYTTPDVPIR
jgi:hypothetical protein